MLGAEPTGFEAWWAGFVNVAYPALNMLFWIVIAGCAIYAVVKWKRYVDAAVSGAGEPPRADDTVSVEEFVE